MPLAGKLTMNAADLFQWVSLAQKSGTLVVAHQSVEKKIFWLCFLILDTVAGFTLPLWWALLATIPAVMISWWVAYRSEWFS